MKSDPMRYSLIPFLALTLLSLHVSAQPAETASASSRKATLLSLGEDIRDLYVRSGEEPRLLRIPASRIPAPVELKPDEDGLFTFFRKQEGENGETTWIPTGRVSIPEPLDHPLLLFLPSRNAETPYRILPFEFSATSFPGGSFFLINLTGKDVKGRIGESPVILPAGNTRNLKPANSDRTLEVLFLYADAQERDALLTTTWFYNPRHRYLVFLYPDIENRDRVGIRTIRNFPSQK